VSDVVVDLRHVRREYQTGDVPTVALADISLTVERGEFVAIVGPSGSGKSTMMNLIGCLDRPSSGDVVISGKNVRDLDDGELTSLRYQGLSPREARRRAADMLTRLGLGERLEFDRSRLSGGQQQRVAIARALVTNPDLVLADEPTGALDTTSGEAVMTLFKEMNAEGRTIVLITHDLDVAAAANRRVYIRDGLIERDERSGVTVGSR
jgi:putative ABC transport system ATP-binding protein